MKVEKCQFNCDTVTIQRWHNCFCYIYVNYLSLLCNRCLFIFLSLIVLSINANPCNSFPCERGATCIPTSSDGYVCLCVDGYAGINCGQFAGMYRRGYLRRRVQVQDCINWLWSSVAHRSCMLFDGLQLPVMLIRSHWLLTVSNQRLVRHIFLWKITRSPFHSVFLSLVLIILTSNQKDFHKLNLALFPFMPLVDFQ